MAGMLITSIIPTMIEMNDGFIRIRPRRAWNQSSRPSTAKAIGVVARATRRASRARALTGSVAQYSLSFPSTTNSLVPWTNPDRPLDARL